MHNFSYNIHRYVDVYFLQYMADFVLDAGQNLSNPLADITYWKVVSPEHKESMVKLVTKLMFCLKKFETISKGVTEFEKLYEVYD